jgi:hypothetical protein
MPDACAQFRQMLELRGKSERDMENMSGVLSGTVIGLFEIYKASEQA